MKSIHSVCAIIYFLSLSLTLICDATIEINAFTEAVLQQSKAAEIASFMDASIDPCDDFYEFACARYGIINPTNNVKSTGFLDHVYDGFQRKVKRLLNSPPDAQNTPEDLQVKMFYNSCLRLEKVESTYQKKLRQIINEFGTMPVLEGDAWHASSFDWLETIARIAHRYGIIIIIGAVVDINDVDNKNNVVILIGQEMYLESRSIYLDNEAANYRKTYTDKIARNLQRWLGLSKDLADVTAKEILSFEVQLARGMIDENEGKTLKERTHITTVADMQRAYAPILDIERLVNVSLGEQVTDSIQEYDVQFQQNLCKVMHETPKRIVANYIYYYLISEFGLEPVQEMRKRQEQCMGVTTKYFASNLDNMVYRYYNNSKAARDIDLMWNNLKLTFEQTLKHDPLLRWMQAETRQLALEKLKAMTLKVNSYSVKELAEEFIGLEMQEEDVLENLRRIQIQIARLMRKKLHEPAKSFQAGEELTFTPANILVENSITVPVSLLQSYYLWADAYPRALMFGTLAAFIGHELMHSFDDQGRSFDLHGNILKDWWDERSNQEFEERKQCFTKQYSQYIYNGKHLPITAAQAENIADNGGVRLAFTAYRNWLNATERSPEAHKLMAKEQLTTLNYTPLQLFFISYAQLWCNELSANLTDWVVATDQHVPGKFRVIGPLANLDEFAKEFQCARNTRMNPVTKCKLY
ncbi:LOW QUALITY PROTEIN: neprilysin-1 [Drosophila busckii]|uniref:LOW QUALITY PROTEIN: neprilysin-1 n=1 Tax=Drosophila busckii TaxID=30019 RepID=UPI001432EB79|nr:LOW QUALITY PROTEIN: neprilysin-1 [Drosophila busckii]